MWDVKNVAPHFCEFMSTFPQYPSRDVAWACCFLGINTPQGYPHILSRPTEGQLTWESKPGAGGRGVFKAGIEGVFRTSGRNGSWGRPASPLLLLMMVLMPFHMLWGSLVEKWPCILRAYSTCIQHFKETPHLSIYPGFLVGANGDLLGYCDVINTFADVAASGWRIVLQVNSALVGRSLSEDLSVGVLIAVLHHGNSCTWPHSDVLLCGLTVSEHRTMSRNQHNRDMVREAQMGQGTALYTSSSVLFPLVALETCTQNWGRISVISVWLKPPPPPKNASRCLFWSLQMWSCSSASTTLALAPRGTYTVTMNTTVNSHGR